jgi:carboxylesterase type B
VIYIHGGGFRNGSKDSLKASILNGLLEARISVAALNYRLVPQSPLPAAHHDCRRALQFLRSRAGDWNIDKTRVGAFGGSAGAQLCMYLAFHDEMADAASNDTLQRESTRLACVATNGGQTTMNVHWWQQHIPGYDQPHRDFQETFGVTDEAAYLAACEEISALSLISRDDPQILMRYSMRPDDPVPDDSERARGWKVHHVRFRIALKERMDALGIESQLVYPGAGDRNDAALVAFFETRMHRPQ